MTDPQETQTPFTALVLRAADPEAVSRFDDPAGLPSALSGKDALAVLVYTAPARALAAHLDEGLEAALRDWCAQAKGWLAVQARHRGRMLLAEAPRDAGAQAELRVALEAFLSEGHGAVAAGLAESFCAAAGLDDDAEDPSLEALAALAVIADPEARELADRIEAGTLGPATLATDMLPVLNRLAGALGAERAGTETLLQAHEDAEARAEGLSEALDAAREALIEARDAEVEQAHALALERRQRSALEVELAAAATAAAAAAAQSEEQQARIAALETTAAGVVELRAALTAAEERATRAENAVIAAEAALAESDDMLRDLRGAEAEVGYAAALLRADLAARESALAETTARAEEAGRAASRVPGLETELAALTAAGHAAEAEGATSAMARDILLGQIAALEQALVRSEAARREAVSERGRLDAFWRRRSAALGAMLDAVHRSTSWRLTRPARAVVRRMRRER